jgi:hypothetical protein
VGAGVVASAQALKTRAATIMIIKVVFNFFEILVIL